MKEVYIYEGIGMEGLEFLVLEKWRFWMVVSLIVMGWYNFKVMEFRELMLDEG